MQVLESRVNPDTAVQPSVRSSWAGMYFTRGGGEWTSITSLLLLQRAVGSLRVGEHLRVSRHPREADAYLQVTPFPNRLHMYVVEVGFHTTGSTMQVRVPGARPDVPSVALAVTRAISGRPARTHVGRDFQIPLEVVSQLAVAWVGTRRLLGGYELVDCAG